MLKEKVLVWVLTNKEQLVLQAGFRDCDLAAISDHAGLPHDTRDALTAQFNDKQSGVDILIMSLRMGSVAPNVQGAYRIPLVFTPPGSFEDRDQLIARSRRLGQTRDTIAIILRLEKIFDMQWLSQHSYNKKAIENYAS